MRAALLAEWRRPVTRGELIVAFVAWDVLFALLGSPLTGLLR